MNSELAAARATGKVMVVLPGCGIGIGYPLGGDLVRGRWLDRRLGMSAGRRSAGVRGRAVDCSLLDKPRRGCSRAIPTSCWPASTSHRKRLLCAGLSGLVVFPAVRRPAIELRWMTRHPSRFAVLTGPLARVIRRRTEAPPLVRRAPRRTGCAVGRRLAGLDSTACCRAGSGWAYQSSPQPACSFLVGRP